MFSTLRTTSSFLPGLVLFGLVAPLPIMLLNTLDSALLYSGIVTDPYHLPAEIAKR